MQSHAVASEQHANGYPTHWRGMSSHCMILPEGLIVCLQCYNRVATTARKTRAPIRESATMLANKIEINFAFYQTRPYCLIVCLNSNSEPDLPQVSATMAIKSIILHLLLPLLLIEFACTMYMHVDSKKLKI